MMRVISLFCFAAVLLLAQAAEAPEKGIVEFTSGQYSEALTDLRAAVARRPDDERAKTFLALTEAALGDCSNAIPELSSELASATAPLDRLAGLALAKCDTAEGHTPAALTALNTLEIRYPRDEDVLYLTAKLHMKAFNDATYDMFQRTPSSYRVHELSAEIFEVQARYSDAVAEYRRAIALNENAPDLHYRLGRALLLQSHSAEAVSEAAQQFRAELRISPEDSGCEYQLGQIADAQGDAKDAKAHFERAAALSPRFVQNLVALGRAFSRDKEFDKSVAVLTKATELQPENEAAHYALLSTYRAAGQLDKAKA